MQKSVEKQRQQRVIEKFCISAFGPPLSKFLRSGCEDEEKNRDLYRDAAAPCNTQPRQFNPSLVRRLRRGSDDGHAG